MAIWEPATLLFRLMDLDPYVPRHVIDSGRYRPTGRIRVVDDPDPCLERSTKIVTVEVRDTAGQVVTDTSSLHPDPESSHWAGWLVRA